MVPQLGGFIAQDVPARYIAEEHLFLPPHKTVGFNPQLTLNDGLLVQSYMQEYEISYPEALRMIEQIVSELKQDILQNGKAELNGIGVLSLNIDGCYDFIPNEGGILSPALYGLDAVNVTEAAATGKTTKSATRRIVPAATATAASKNYTLSINREFVNYVAAVITSIFFYFMWATPVTDSASLTPHQASMLFPHSIQHVELPQADTTGLADMPADTLAAPTDIPEPADTTAAATTAYTIVLASRIPEANAENFLQQLKQEGYEDARILQKRNIIRVVTGNFTSETAAQDEMNRLRDKDSRFKDAWILNNL